MKPHQLGSVILPLNFPSESTGRIDPYLGDPRNHIVRPPPIDVSGMTGSSV